MNTKISVLFRYFHVGTLEIIWSVSKSGLQKSPVGCMCVHVCVRGLRLRNIDRPMEVKFNF